MPSSLFDISTTFPCMGIEKRRGSTTINLEEVLTSALNRQQAEDCSLAFPYITATAKQTSGDFDPVDRKELVLGDICKSQFEDSPTFAKTENITDCIDDECFYTSSPASTITYTSASSSGSLEYSPSLSTSPVPWTAFLLPSHSRFWEDEDEFEDIAADIEAYVFGFGAQEEGITSKALGELHAPYDKITFDLPEERNLDFSWVEESFGPWRRVSPDEPQWSNRWTNLVSEDDDEKL